MTVVWYPQAGEVARVVGALLVGAPDEALDELEVG